MKLRYTVFRDFYNCHGDNVIEPWVILYGTEAEANECMARLNDPLRADRSYHNPDDEDSGFLYVDQICI